MKEKYSKKSYYRFIHKLYFLIFAIALVASIGYYQSKVIEFQKRINGEVGILQGKVTTDSMKRLETMRANQKTQNTADVNLTDTASSGHYCNNDQDWGGGSIQTVSCDSIDADRIRYTNTAGQNLDMSCNTFTSSSQNLRQCVPNNDYTCVDCAPVQQSDIAYAKCGQQTYGINTGKTSSTLVYVLNNYKSILTVCPEGMQCGQENDGTVACDYFNVYPTEAKCDRNVPGRYIVRFNDGHTEEHYCQEPQPNCTVQSGNFDACQ